MPKTDTFGAQLSNNHYNNDPIKALSRKYGRAMLDAIQALALNRATSMNEDDPPEIILNKYEIISMMTKQHRNTMYTKSETNDILLVLKGGYFEPYLQEQLKGCSVSIDTDHTTDDSCIAISYREATNLWKTQSENEKKGIY